MCGKVGKMRVRAMTNREILDMFDKPEFAEKSCYYCIHSITATIDGVEYDLCVVERDRHGSGDVYECDPEETDCEDWEG